MGDSGPGARIGGPAIAGSVVAMIVAALVGAGPAFAVTINVDTNVEESLPSDDGDCSFQEALLSSGNDGTFDQCEVGSGPDVINLQPTTYSITTPLIVSDNEVTIDGDGQSSTAIDANDNSRVIQVSGPNDPVLIQDLTIRDGLSASGGAGIQNFGDLALDQVTVTSNEASANLGGGITNSASGILNVLDSSIDANVGWGIHNEGTLTVTDSSVSDNTDAPGPSPDEGGINNPGVATVEGSTISGNSDQGIYSVGTLTVTDTVVSGNTASTGTVGGGISVLSNSMAGTTTVLDNVTITGNTALSGGGGGIANGSQFPGNPSNLTITDSTIANNDAGSGGGFADFADAGTTTIVRTTISGNSAVTAEGGGLVKSSDDAAMVVTNSTVSGNDAVANGAGIHNGGPLSLTFSTVSENTSTSGSGGIQTGGTLNIGSTIVANNTGFPGSGDDCFGSLTSQGYNLIENIDPGQCVIGGDTTGNIIGSDPVLGSLANNGGSTETHALLPGSPAINAANPGCPPPATDQRGSVRQPGRTCDIGAFEILESPVPAPIPEDPVPAPPPDAGDTTPPDTQITEGPKDKTKKKQATFEFSSNEPGSSFQCTLDGQTNFKPCSSPLTVKVKKGKHSFQVQATDQAGNTDASPASDDWKVKRRKKK